MTSEMHRSGLLSRVNPCFIIMTIVCMRLHVRCVIFSAVIMSGQWPIIVSVTLFSANEMIAVSIVTIQLRTITSGALVLALYCHLVCLVYKKLRNLLGARCWNVEKADSAALCLFQCSNAQIGKLDCVRHPS